MTNCMKISPNLADMHSARFLLIYYNKNDTLNHLRKKEIHIMKKIQLGNTGIFVTPIGFGVLTIGNTKLNLTLEEGAKFVRYAYDHGINFFDTAQYYETYKYMRVAFAGIDMSPENPDRPIIASKCLDSSYEEMEFAIKECMDEIGLEIIDIFLLHEVRSDPDFDNRSGAWQ